MRLAIGWLGKRTLVEDLKEIKSKTLDIFWKTSGEILFVGVDGCYDMKHWEGISQKDLV